ncbi:hypothetical protein [Vulcaniibacterium gelatinicum]|uniref:hypothetical protein n=1 Tax=Vulcaniibacterium gelatinicum TaxID=2598725 RepID=UPI0011CA5BA4|nr:hypothetical protein [Vulcaniibacterium gelatinicum]
MNPHEIRDEFDPRLRLALRGLRREALPEHELWPGIAARIAQAPQRRPASPRRPTPWALAASLLLAVGLAWQLRPPPAVAPEETPLALEAQALTREYEAALQHFAGVPLPDEAALRELDRSAAQIRQALRRDPDARFLLDRLQDIYARRLALTQRLARHTA